jgi:DNA-binding response OmpR family regulator
MASSEVQKPRGVVLAVAGDPATRLVVRKFCTLCRMECRLVPDAAAARRTISEIEVSGILCWSDVPGADGIEFGAELRQLAPHAHVVLVLAAEHANRSTDARLAVEHVIGAPQLESLFEALRAMATRGPAPSRHHLLLVDEDLYLASVLKRGLESSFTITVVPSASAALAALGTIVPDAVVAELQLDMAADAFHTALDAAVPGLGERVVYMTGGIVDDATHAFLASIPGRWVYKPFPIATLRSLIASALGRRAP